MNDETEGSYANYFEVGFNVFEFVFDFGQFYPQNGEPEFHTRIITTPAYAKAMLETLETSIQQYEQTFGAISSEQ